MQKVNVYRSKMKKQQQQQQQKKRNKNIVE